MFNTVLGVYLRIRGYPLPRMQQAFKKWYVLANRFYLPTNICFNPGRFQLPLSAGSWPPYQRRSSSPFFWNQYQQPAKPRDDWLSTYSLCHVRIKPVVPWQLAKKYLYSHRFTRLFLPYNWGCCVKYLR